LKVVTLTAKDDLSFLCVCDDVTQVSRVLEALHFKMPGSTARRVFATVKLGANGVRFTIEETQQFQANGMFCICHFCISVMFFPPSFVDKGHVSCV
jgi:hypothetical protein